jgi:hypothetical protein
MPDVVGPDRLSPEPHDDPDRRFDYLFEPLESEEANTDADSIPATESNADNRRSRTAVRIGIAAVICATIATVIATVMLLLRQPERSDIINIPVSTTPTSAPPIITTPAVLEATPEVTASSVQTPAPTVIVEPQPPLPPAPTTSASAPDVPTAPEPTIRPPISVEPEPHPPFPNQVPSQDENQPGGLLPGGLPGPL